MPSVQYCTILYNVFILYLRESLEILNIFHTTIVCPTYIGVSFRPQRILPIRIFDHFENTTESTVTSKILFPSSVLCKLKSLRLGITI